MTALSHNRTWLSQDKFRIFGRFHTQFSSDSRPHEGFTLFELLVVMIVIALLTAVAWSGFLGLRTTMYLYQSSQAFRADIIYTQRSAMLLDRAHGELWVHGLGMDLRNYDGIPGDGQTYTLFKMCSSEYNYTDYVPASIVSFVAGGESYQADCLTSGLAFLPGKRDVKIQGGRLGSCVVNSDRDEEQYRNLVNFISFEAVNGRPHFYDALGNEITSSTHPDLEGVRIAYYMNDRYNSVAIKLTGEITYEGYDPDKPNPCD